MKGIVAFALKPVADVGPSGEVPVIGPRYFPFCTKYIRAASAHRNRKKHVSVSKKQIIERIWQLTGHRLSSTWIRDVDKFLDENTMLLVVPITQNHSEFLVVSVNLRGRVDGHGCAQPIDILTLTAKHTVSFTKK